ncbi:MAG: RNase adapter RapZ [Rhodospirillaceae bacterium]|nr:RNase adapter RapZ [Rhodospirillaceae bacterium]MBT5242006.1 RNase adapter RapZ [Rhodospirillaceae bacterium]MBT5565731.1 RNase adapter RapZ [Rhodospirillaceae bacterium]MBT6088542.1 RNase adapter RapZ [Rhodospirillaceae bacterium]MBT6960383.1 RNase adapter RapZ [Rhodospirillaceae bacterium]
MITGMSGAGKSSALHAMEDLGFETVDNLPVSLLEAAMRGGGPDRPLAVGMDVRTRDFNTENLIAQIQALGDQRAIVTTLIYLDSDDDVLMRRYTETRRPHPLAGDLPVAGAISLERELLAPVKAVADLVLDTSSLTPGDLKRQLEKTYGGDDDRPMHIQLVSFGYRNGVPREADLVFDVRFLRNPHYVDSLQHQSGLDDPVGEYISDDPAFTPFMINLLKLVEPLLPRYREEGKSYLTIAIGCTGGHHRSVYTVKELALRLKNLGIEFDFRHRDLNVEPSRSA